MIATFALEPGRTTTSERLLLLALADVASDDGEVAAYARSQVILAEKCGWSAIDTVRKVLRALEAKALVVSRGTGGAGKASDYFLPYVANTPAGSLAEIIKARRRAGMASPPNGGGVPPPYGGGDPLQTEGVHIDTTHTDRTQDVRSRVPGLKAWFNNELWPCFPSRIDKAGAWLEIERINPGEKLRAEILEGLERAKRERERIAAENDDGFAPCHPLPRNWLRSRRWEDECA
jgi:hypothetical protein